MGAERNVFSVLSTEYSSERKKHESLLNAVKGFGQSGYQNRAIKTAQCEFVFQRYSIRPPSHDLVCLRIRAYRKPGSYKYTCTGHTSTIIIIIAVLLLFLFLATI